MSDTYAIVISGKVQGVFFRASARKVAQDLGLSGFVKNETNGQVYLEATGPKTALDKLVAWCRKGPRWSQVESVEVKKITGTSYAVENGFVILG